MARLYSDGHRKCDWARVCGELCNGTLNMRALTR
jgi:hypothetical protein